MTIAAEPAAPRPARSALPLPHDWHTVGVFLPPSPGTHYGLVFVAPDTLAALLNGRHAHPAGGVNRMLAMRIAAALIHAGWAVEVAPHRYVASAQMRDMAQNVPWQ